MSRSYEDPCGIARALDRVGERWALLVARELFLGPKRFTDLRSGLPAASPNVLSQRLRELEDAGVIGRRELPAPAACTVYELTPWGRELEPVVLALARWGRRALPLPKGQLSLDALLFALRSTFDPTVAQGRFELRLGHDVFTAVASRQGLAVTRGPCEAPDAVISGTPAELRSSVFRAERQAVKIEGDLRAGRRFLCAFA
jgi:DNA-binding HxlR family transcriptional regulator